MSKALSMIPNTKKKKREHTCWRGYREVQKRESLRDGGNVNCYRHYTVWRCLKILKIELPYDPAISILDMYTEIMKSVSAFPCMLHHYSQ
jgi:hypothetical protein